MTCKDWNLFCLVLNGVKKKNKMIRLWNFDITKGQGRQNCIRYNEFSLDRGLFFIWDEENSLLYPGHHHIEVRYIEVQR